MNEHDDIARELHATRAEPSQEFARQLDERAAEWLREQPSRRWPSLRIAIPAAAAAAAAAVVIAIALSGDDDAVSDRLEVAVVADQGAVDALGGGGSELKLESEAAPRATEGGFAAPRSPRVEQGEPLVVRYFFTAPTDGTVELAGREASLDVPAGAGRLEISTEGLDAGRQVLEIKVPAAPLYRERIEIAD